MHSIEASTKESCRLFWVRLIECFGLGSAVGGSSFMSIGRFTLVSAVVCFFETFSLPVLLVGEEPLSERPPLVLGRASSLVVVGVVPGRSGAAVLDRCFDAGLTVLVVVQPSMSDGSGLRRPGLLGVRSSDSECPCVWSNRAAPDCMSWCGSSLSIRELKILSWALPEMVRTGSSLASELKIASFAVLDLPPFLRGVAWEREPALRLLFIMSLLMIPRSTPSSVEKKIGSSKLLTGFAPVLDFGDVLGVSLLRV
mmetsp:Transcript_5361/g.12601  ORF Transcript_5361/g.12601 Transcript_5361/m.12601 type:complete len:254 (-) Transcript_5361:87-848(-)